jgi:hypothetical protein
MNQPPVDHGRSDEIGAERLQRLTQPGFQQAQIRSRT